MVQPNPDIATNQTKSSNWLTKTEATPQTDQTTFFTVARKNTIITELSQKYLKRIKDKRSLLQQQRRNEICNSSSFPANLIEDEIMKFEPADLEDILDDCPPEMTVDEWNKVYAEVTTELHEAIAKQLLLERE
jgi:hypothetical protein